MMADGSVLQAKNIANLNRNNFLEAEETVKAPRLIVRLNAGNWRFCMPPPRQHHIGVKVPRWDFAATDDDQVHDGHVH